MSGKCFIIAPISTPPDLVGRYGGNVDHFRDVIELLLVPAVTEAGFEPISPIAEGSELVHAWIVRHLESSGMVLCDLTSLNPNVMFEMGIRIATGKPIALIRDCHQEFLPFDTAVVNTPHYDPSLSMRTGPAQVSALAHHVKVTFEKSGGANPMWQSFGLTTRASMRHVDAATTDEKLDFLIREMAAAKRQQTLLLVADARHETRLQHEYLRQAFESLSPSERSRISGVVAGWARGEVEAFEAAKSKVPDGNPGSGA